MICIMSALEKCAFHGLVMLAGNAAGRPAHAAAASRIRHDNG